MDAASLQAPRAAEGLERALVFTFVAHAVAMIGMVMFLLPGVPGGAAATVAERAAYLSAHPWLWRVGWLGWQVTAASDLYLSIALVRTVWMPKGPAWFALITTILALLPDQIGQLIWMWIGPDRAMMALARNDLTSYATFEGRLFQAVGGWGAGLYLIAAIGWSVCLYRAGTWSRALGWLSVGAWSLFAVAVTALCLPRTTWTPLSLSLVGGLNATAFVLLMGWIAEAGEQVMRRARPDAQRGRLARWIHPQRTIYGRVVTYTANSRFLRGLFEYVPALSMKSDVRDVIYVNYLVDADSVAAYVPPPLQLQRVGEGGRQAVFTFLIYRHGHFGPKIFGPFRRLWRSPIQSNWRLYVTDPASGLDGVYFVTTAITAVPYALAARLLSEGVPMHVPRNAEMTAQSDGGWAVVLNPGEGTAPDAKLLLHDDDSTELPPSWRAAFATRHDALRYIVPQDRAINVQPWHGRVVVQEISLNIPIADCRWLCGAIASATAERLVGNAAACCFYVPRVSFHYDGERGQAWMG